MSCSRPPRRTTCFCASLLPTAFHDVPRIPKKPRPGRCERSAFSHTHVSRIHRFFRHVAACLGDCGARRRLLAGKLAASRGIHWGGTSMGLVHRGNSQQHPACERWCGQSSRALCLCRIRVGAARRDSAPLSRVSLSAGRRRAKCQSEPYAVVFFDGVPPMVDRESRPPGLARPGDALSSGRLLHALTSASATTCRRGAAIGLALARLTRTGVVHAIFLRSRDACTRSVR